MVRWVVAIAGNEEVTRLGSEAPKRGWEHLACPLAASSSGDVTSPVTPLLRCCFFSGELPPSGSAFLSGSVNHLLDEFRSIRYSFSAVLYFPATHHPIRSVLSLAVSRYSIATLSSNDGE
ncbi:hypothetical protein L2E82_34114 [Cichorium intybus]|uniref:Uncharacterized protein n=1 Tax=Cichorium intybus TaxID=13427 RepID=A0ACB9BLL8_CICIN|nr:hypothetical protein L2E82_34114 [Cichorium intybus]